MSSKMYEDLIQYQAKRIEALANELKTQEAKYKELHELSLELAKGSVLLQNQIKELKKKLNDEK